MGGTRVAIGDVVQLHLCRDHAHAVMSIVTDATPDGQHDDGCEMCTAGMSSADYCERLVRAVRAVPMTVRLLLKGRTDHDWTMGYSEFVQRHAASPFAGLTRHTLAQRLTLFSSAPLDNGGLDSEFAPDMLDELLVRLGETGLDVDRPRVERSPLPSVAATLRQTTRDSVVG